MVIVTYPVERENFCYCDLELSKLLLLFIPGLDLLDFEFNLMRDRNHCCVYIHDPKFLPARSGYGCEEEKGLESDLYFLCV
jgi:hypothetical protein